MTVLVLLVVGLYALPKLDKLDVIGTDSTIRRTSRRLLLRRPALTDGESVLWARGCNWVRNGTLSIGGGLFILDSGRVVWRSSRIGLPVCEWAVDLAEVRSVEFIEGSMARKAEAMFGAGGRRNCELILNDGTTLLIFPAQLGEVLIGVKDLAPRVGIEEALIDTLETQKTPGLAE